MNEVLEELQAERIAGALTSGEVAATLGVTPARLHRLKNAGRIAAAFRLPIGVRGALMYDPVDVARLARELAEARVVGGVEDTVDKARWIPQ